MSPSTVLVTGVSRFVGGELVARLAADTAIERVLGVDTVGPRRDLLRRMGRAEFVPVDLRNPLIAKVISAARVDTVVHASMSAGSRDPADPRNNGGRNGRSAMKEMNVIGTIQLLAACQKLTTVSRLVMKSTGAVYGVSARDQAVFTENDRVQLLHEEDALAVLERATKAQLPGVFNVGGDGVLLLSQAIRRVGRLPVPIPEPAVATVGWLLRSVQLVDYSPEQSRFLNFGRVLDTTRLRTEFGFAPRLTTAQAFDDYVHGRALRPTIDPKRVAAAQRCLLTLAARLR